MVRVPKTPQVVHVLRIRPHDQTTHNDTLHRLSYANRRKHSKAIMRVQLNINMDCIFCDVVDHLEIYVALSTADCSPMPSLHCTKDETE